MVLLLGNYTLTNETFYKKGYDLIQNCSYIVFSNKYNVKIYPDYIVYLRSGHLGYNYLNNLRQRGILIFTLPRKYPQKTSTE